MTRQELLLAMLAAADGRPYSPVQIQKAMFLLEKHVPSLVDSGPSFSFAAYDYGPFDSAVYSEAENLKASGLAHIAPSDVGRWNTYSASDLGVEKGRKVLERIPTASREYLVNVSAWVRAQSFSSLVKSIYDFYPEMKVNSIFKG